MTKNIKFVIKEPNGTERAQVQLTKEGTKIWRAGDPAEIEEIRKTVAEAAKETLKLDAVVVTEIESN